MHRQPIGEELQRLGTPADPAIERAKKLLGDFTTFGELAPSRPSAAGCSQCRLNRDRTRLE
jgi:hypothetical protein